MAVELKGKQVFSFFVIAAFVYLIFPFLTPMLMGTVFAVLFYPCFAYLRDKRVPPFLATLLVTLSMTVLLIIPALVVLVLVAKTGIEQAQQFIMAGKAGHVPGKSFLEKMVASPVVQKMIYKLSIWFPLRMNEVLDSVQSELTDLGIRFADQLGHFLTKLPSAALAGVIMILCIFFVVLDGERLLDFGRRHSVFSQIQTELLIKSFAKMARSVVLATVVSGAVQAVIYSLACLILGLPHAAVIGVLVFFASFLPLVGSAPVTFGIAILAFFLGSEVQISIILSLVAVGVTLLDNLVRPLVLTGAGDLHPALAFIAAIGGVKVLGISGIFLGPILAGMFVVTVRILIEKEKTL